MSDIKKTTIKVPKMDCPSEEKLIRMALNAEPKIAHLKFDLAGRLLTVFHETDENKIITHLAPLNFGALHVETKILSEVEENLLQLEKAKSEGRESAEAKVLKVLLAINASMFFFEIVLGFIAQSTGLIADSFDMFADAAVYGVSLYAVGKSILLQHKVARVSGYLQMALAVFVFIEVVRRFYYGSSPEPDYMVLVSLVALAANVTCLVLISRHRDGGAHMKASMIFSANDVIANLGVIAAGLLVSTTKSSIPDLVIGIVIAAIVFRGSLSILRIAKVNVPTKKTPT